MQPGAGTEAVAVPAASGCCVPATSLMIIQDGSPEGRTHTTFSAPLCVIGDPWTCPSYKERKREGKGKQGELCAGGGGGGVAGQGTVNRDIGKRGDRVIKREGRRGGRKENRGDVSSEEKVNLFYRWCSESSARKGKKVSDTAWFITSWGQMARPSTFILASNHTFTSLHSTRSCKTSTLKVIPCAYTWVWKAKRGKMAAGIHACNTWTLWNVAFWQFARGNCGSHWQK